MITIGKPFLETNNGKVRLSSEITCDGKCEVLWFEVAEEYGEYLLVERSDAFVVGLLHYAMRKGHDIVSDTPMTVRMYEQLTEQFLPAYYRVNKMAHQPCLEVPTADEVSHCINGNCVGTGVSCGVDSLHVFAMHDEISHACLWNMHGVTNNETEAKRKLWWRNQQKQAQRFADYIGCKLVIGETNYDRGVFPDLAFDGSTTYGNLFCVLALEKLWSKYYVASGYDIRDFSLSLGVEADPAHYEYMLFSFLSTDHLSLRIDGAAQNRIEKVGDLVSYEPSWKFLNVCWDIREDGGNCSRLCPKCMRTMLNLDAWGALDSYHEVFDVPYYRAHFEEYLAELYRGYLQGNNFAIEQRPYFKRLNIPLRIKLKAAWIVLKKATRKLLRLGRINHEFVSR